MSFPKILFTREVAASASRGKCSLVKGNNSWKTKQFFRGKCPPGFWSAAVSLQSTGCLFALGWCWEVPRLRDHLSSQERAQHQNGQILLHEGVFGEQYCTHEVSAESWWVYWLGGFSFVGEKKKNLHKGSLWAVLVLQGPGLFWVQANFIRLQFLLELVPNSSLHKPPNSKEGTFPNTWIFFTLSLSQLLVLWAPRTPFCRVV